MKIDFSKIERQEIPNFKGGELHYDVCMFDHDGNKIMDGVLVPGASIGMHTHADSCEVIFVTSGEGTVVMEGKEEVLRAGDCHYCPKGHAHSLINRGDKDLRFHAVVAQK